MLNFDALESNSERIEFIQNMGNLIERNEITPARLNEGLANYYPALRFLTDIYESVASEMEKAKLEYDLWYANLFIEERARLNDGQPKSKFASQAEINSAIITNNGDDYRSLKNDLILKERRVSFYRRLLDGWKTQSNILINLSQNMRSEMMALKVEDRANKDMTRENIIRHNRDGLTEMRKVKKIKQEL